MTASLPPEAPGCLAPAERHRLAELEAVVERGMQTFVEVGQALMEIRDARLYRGAYGTFQAYLIGRWGVSRATGYRMIDAAHVAELVSPIGDIANEAQARELVPLFREDEQAVVEVWRDLRAEFGEQVTAERVRRLVRRRLERVGRETARVERLASIAPPVFDDIEIRHGDFRFALTDLDGQVEAIVCDPPYERVWIERDADDFAAMSARLLKPTGALVVMFGAAAHYDLKPRLDAHLRHRWTCCYYLPGWGLRVFSAGLANQWKPILVYQRNDSPEEREFLGSDVFVSDAADKTHHRWGQSESGITRLVEAFSRPGDLVVDPFLGGGTTAVVCRGLGRRFIGCDVDQGAIAIARARLAATDLPTEAVSA